ncbi:hypothetical protein BKA65DRAFT_549278 [Rhexocercosporidium sp. MPI-PUGE-AT-0058]|nr:hypothetical protein BKA65DRAFT_549278 [Rhexocercosporidium sp. MPI-PUGE-AT-0058]
MPGLLVSMSSFCASRLLAQSTSACLNANCTMHDGLGKFPPSVAIKVSASLCRKPLGQSRSDLFLATTIVVYSVAVIFVALRFITKAMKGTKGRVDWSDWLLFFAVFCAIPNFYFCVKGKNGFGKHFWELQDGQLKEILKMIYVAEVVYIIQLAIPKLSILVFYIQSIPNEGFRLAVFITMCLVVISTTIISTLAVVGCHPIPSFWDRDIKGHCLDINGVAYGIGGLSIVQDLVIIALPIPILKNMRLPWREKAMVLFMFAVGSSSVVISILRLQSIAGFGDSLDPSWDYTVITTWSIFEVYIAIITASLPTIRHLLVYLFPRSCAMARPNREARSAPTGVSWFRRRQVATKAPQISTLKFSTNGFGREYGRPGNGV